jgi:polygalacturonase
MLCLGFILTGYLTSVSLHAAVFDVRTYGAVGDGKTLDTPAINKAIEAAAAAGGGTVQFPAGTYLSGSIHLKSHIALYLSHGATIEATSDVNAYDPPEPNEWGDKYQYQDFGHSHWHNSLIWGESIEDVSISGPGRLYGKGLSRSLNRVNPKGSVGNKTIALKLCRNVTVRDITVQQAGHFGILPTGVDNFTIDNVRIDTNRDGINIDCCRNVRISNCSINSPSDDALVLKSSYALGYARATENVTITNCQVSGYSMGSFLDGTYKRSRQQAPDRDGPTGRIKFGTESNGGFKNITISNCVFDNCRGLALETVDGGLLEDVTITNITMRGIVNSPIFLRLGSRMRGPKGVPVGELRRVNISNIVVYDADPRYSSIISGIPGHDIEDVKLSNIRIVYQGGGTKEQAEITPPENENKYPEPSMFGVMPAYGFFIRHAKGLELSDIHISYVKDDLRPAFVLNDVNDVDFRFIKAQHGSDVPIFSLKKVEGFRLQQCDGLADTKRENVQQEKL